MVWNCNKKLGQSVAYEAIEKCIELADKFGIGQVSVDSAFHYLWGGGYVLDAAKRGYIVYAPQHLFRADGYPQDVRRRKDDRMRLIGTSITAVEIAKISMNAFARLADAPSLIRIDRKNQSPRTANGTYALNPALWTFRSNQDSGSPDRHLAPEGLATSKEL